MHDHASVAVQRNIRTCALKYDTFFPGKRVHERSFVIWVVKEAIVAQIVHKQEHHCVGRQRFQGWVSGVCELPVGCSGAVALLYSHFCECSTG